jgi:3-oxoacyl-(acyl-carrier-protein) synthase
MPETPEKASRPMSATAAGIMPAAGAGILLLESLSSAKERGARIYAEVLGAASNNGGQRMGGSLFLPNAEGTRRCIRDAVANAGIRPEQIDAINGHLSASVGDTQEVESWRDALGLSPSKMPLLHATKSLIGHALGAAGGIESVATVLELDGGFVHGSLNCEDLHPALAPYADRIPHSTVQVPDLRVIAKASFGFGDANACVVFRKFER